MDFDTTDGRPEECCITRKGEEWKSIDGNRLVERKNFKPLAAIASSGIPSH